MTNQMLNIPTRRMLTAGILPSKAEFEAAWDRQSLPNDRLSFGNDRFVGTINLTCQETWEELVLSLARSDSDDVDPWGNPPEYSGQWCSDVLSVFGFEWV